MKKQITSHNKRLQKYVSPVITYKGDLVQFAGSPLNTLLDNPLNLPQQ